jgi:hypothetical protein
LDADRKRDDETRAVEMLRLALAGQLKLAPMAAAVSSKTDSQS